MKSTTFFTTLAALFIIGAASCSTNRLESRIEEREASLATLAWLADRYGLEDDTDLQNLIKRVTRQLAAYSPESEAQYWTIAVIRSAEPNAFSSGAETIVLTRGLLESCETEAQLAAVIAHEMSHHLLGHTRRALRSAEDRPYPTLTLSLQEELDADTLSIAVLRSAGYNPAQAVFSLAFAYRPEQGNGYLPEWYQARLSNLERLTARDHDGPYTTSTREFSRLRSRLRSR